jgi:outer membrane protein TolC
MVVVLERTSSPVVGRGRGVARLALAIAALAAPASDAAAQRARPTDPNRVPTARPGTPIALPDALQVALRQSPSISRAVIDIEAARADALAAQGIDDFTLSAVASLTRAWTWQTGSSPGAYLQDAAGLGAGLSRKLPTGGTVTANASAQAVSERFEPDGAPAVDTFSGVVTNLSAGVSHPLLRGLGQRIARADQRRASVARDVASLSQAAEALNVVRDVIVAYWQVAYARQVVDIRIEGMKLALEQLRITNTAVRTGSVSPTEVPAAEQSIAQREQAVIQAQVAVSELSLEFRRKVGLEIGRDQIDLAPSTPLVAPTPTFDVDATIARAIRDNPVLAMLEAKGKAADIEVEVSEDAIRPRLDVQAQLGSTGHATSAVDSIKQLGRFDNPSVAITLGYEQQLGSHAARGARDRAQAQRRRVRLDAEAARREITVSVVHAIDLLRAAQQRIEVSDRAIGLARRTLEIQQTRFLNGKATNFDVVLRQDELQQASVSRALAVSDALAAEATVYALTGELLDRNHIRIVP